MNNEDLKQTILYHQVEPTATQATYGEFDNVDFVVNVGEGRSYLKNSFRVLADVLITTDGATRVTTEQVGWDRNAGGHCFIDSLQVSMQNTGQVESIQNYSRYVSMASHATKDRLDLLNSENQCELRSHLAQGTDLWAQGISTYVEAPATATVQDVDMSIMPVCALNRMVGADLPSRKSGSMTLTLNMARNVQALRGRDQTAAFTYVLTNLRCTFRSVADDGVDDPTGMSIIYNIKSNILSGTASVAANIPAMCSGVSMSFIDTAREATIKHNSYALEPIQGISEVQYIMNDQTNSLTTTVISDRTEMLERAKDSMPGDSSHNQVAKDVYYSNEGFMLGIDFDGEIDLSSNRFMVQIQSTANNRSSNAYLYFHSNLVV
mgnify:FL=1